MLSTGGGSFQGSDMFEYDGKGMVVGLDDSHRLVRTVSGGVAAEDLLLSPDGRFVAAQDALEGGDESNVSGSGETMAQLTSILDLMTGKVRVYQGGARVAWSQDGDRLLTGT